MSSQRLKLKIPTINIQEVVNQNESQSTRRFRDPFKPQQPGQTYKLRPTNASRKYSVRENCSGLNPQSTTNFTKIDSNQAKSDIFIQNQIQIRPQFQQSSHPFENPRVRKLVSNIQKFIKNEMKQQNENQYNYKYDLPLITDRPRGFLGSYRAGKFKIINKGQNFFSQSRRSQTPQRQQKQKVLYFQNFEVDSPNNKNKPRSARSITPQPIISNQMKFPVKDFLNSKKKSKAAQIDLFTKALIQEPAGKETPQFQFEKNSEISTEANSKQRVDISSSEELGQIFSRQKVIHTTENKDIQLPLQISSMSQVMKRKIADEQQLKQKLLKLAVSDSENGFEISFSQDIESIQVTPQRSAIQQVQQQKFSWEKLEDKNNVHDL